MTTSILHEPELPIQAGWSDIQPVWAFLLASPEDANPWLWHEAAHMECLRRMALEQLVRCLVGQEELVCG